MSGWIWLGAPHPTGLVRNWVLVFALGVSPSWDPEGWYGAQSNIDPTLKLDLQVSVSKPRAQGLFHLRWQGHSSHSPDIPLQLYQEAYHFSWGVTWEWDTGPWYWWDMLYKPSVPWLITLGKFLRNLTTAPSLPPSQLQDPSPSWTNQLSAELPFV